MRRNNRRGSEIKRGFPLEGITCFRCTKEGKVQSQPQLMLMKSWQQQGLKREPMMQGKRPNTVVVLFLHAHKLALPESRSLSQRAPTWMIGQDSVCIWYVVSFRQDRTDRPATTSL